MSTKNTPQDLPQQLRTLRDGLPRVTHICQYCRNRLRVANWKGEVLHYEQQPGEPLCLCDGRFASDVLGDSARHHHLHPRTADVVVIGPDPERVERFAAGYRDAQLSGGSVELLHLERFMKAPDYLRGFWLGKADIL